MLLPTVLMTLVVTAACTDVKIVWQHAKSSSQTSLIVYNSNDTLIAHSCSSIISGTAAIDFSNVDDNGFGRFIVGSNNYTVHSEAEYSGGPICTMIHSPSVAVVECSGIAWSSSSTAAITAKNCHSKEDETSFDLFSSRRRSLMRVAKPVVDNLQIVVDNSTHIDERGVRECNILRGTKLVGNGDPHQNFFDRQLSEVISCGAALQCSAGRSVSKSYTVGFSASATAYQWISGGFDVSQTIETGNNFECVGQTGQQVCMWFNTAHTAYTVQNIQKNTCESKWSDDGAPYVMASPNANNRNGGYYCVVGTCRAQGDAYWDRSGRAGGP